MAMILELIPETDGDRVRLRTPEVGTFTCSLSAGALVAPKALAGVIHSLGRRFQLVVPPGVTGRIATARPERVHEAVGWGTVLYELEPLEAGAAATANDKPKTSAATAALVLRAPYSGRFWHRPAPGDPAFVEPGRVVTEGQTIGLLEVMKTFTQLAYRAERGLPPRARIVRIAVPDGGEVKDGGVLLELEPG
jgi:biotin carboxyl carrier protein